jgi:serine/threonine-protein kinase
MMLQIGDQFDHYQIQSHMAQGGMSDVYRATDLLTGRDVVLKIPNKYMIGDPAQYERFQRELEVMSTLSHPAIQKGLNSGQYNRTPFLVTELIEGQSLRDYIQSKSPIPQDDAVALIRKIAEGLYYCHQHEVVHRDLKPENILITASGQPVILDFGLALTKGGKRVTYANLSSTVGTPDYMAPEQIEGQRGDERTDLYAVGTILYELLTGNTPFTGDNNLAVMAQHLQGEIPRLDKLQAGVSPQIAAVVAKTLQRNPDDRYANLSEFIAALDHPEKEDVTILDKATGPASAAPFWRNETVKLVAMTVLIMAVIVFLGFAAQAIGK